LGLVGVDNWPVASAMVVPGGSGATIGVVRDAASKSSWCTTIDGIVSVIEVKVRSLLRVLEQALEQPRTRINSSARSFPSTLHAGGRCFDPEEVCRHPKMGTSHDTRSARRTFERQRREQVSAVDYTLVFFIAGWLVCCVCYSDAIYRPPPSPFGTRSLTQFFLSAFSSSPSSSSIWASKRPRLDM